GLLVTHDGAAAEGLVAVLGRVELDPVVRVRAPQGRAFTGVDDGPVTRVPVAALDMVDARIFHGAGHLAVRGADAVRPLLVDRLLEAEDELVLEHLLQVAINRGTDVIGSGHVASGVDRTDLRAEVGPEVGATGDGIDTLDPAVEHVVGVLIRAAAAEIVGQLVGQRSVVATRVAEDLGRAVALHVPAEAEARSDHVTEVGLGESRARSQLVVELVGADADVQQYVWSHAPAVFDVDRLRFGRNRGTGDVVAGVDVGRHAVGNRCPVGELAIVLVRGDADRGVAHTVTGIHP